jgi:hypothetical protein
LWTSISVVLSEAVILWTEQYAYTLPPRLALTVRGRHGCRSHVLQTIAPRQLPGDLSQETRALATGLEGFLRRLKQHRGALC